MYLPSIRQLQYLLAVIELRHFGRAAERCFVTQSTLSSGIQELENMLGVQLLERSRRKVEPTPLGIQLSKKAKEILELSTEIVEIANGDKAPLQGILKLGVIPTIGPFLLPRILPCIRQRFPNLELYLVEDQTKNLIERLHNGEIDSAVLALPFDIGNLEQQEFMREEFWVVFPAGHPLANGGAIESKSLPNDQLLLLEEGHCFRDHVISACQRGKLKTKSGFQGTSLYTLIEMVASGHGITFLPNMAIDTNLSNRKDISLRPLAETGPHREIGLVWRSTYHRRSDLNLLAECMTESMDKGVQK